MIQQCRSHKTLRCYTLQQQGIIPSYAAFGISGAAAIQVLPEPLKPPTTLEPLMR